MERGAGEELEGRVARLEKQARRWRAATLVLALGLGVLLTAAFTGQDFDHGFILPHRPQGIRAPAFLLTDQNGKVHGEWTMQGDQPVLKLYGRDGKVLWVAPPRAEFKPVGAKK
jgi:hypothetical protein